MFKPVNFVDQIQAWMQANPMESLFVMAVLLGVFCWKAKDWI